jgi:hypothetical protein
MLAYLVLLAKYLQCVSFIPERPYYEEKANFHALMAELCASEGTLMTRMAESCSVRANSGAAWEGPSEEADDLKCCPYPSDCPQHGSWSEQAAVWERAARRSLRAAEWNSRMRDYCRGWGPIAPQQL